MSSENRSENRSEKRRNRKEKRPVSASAVICLVIWLTTFCILVGLFAVAMVLTDGGTASLCGGGVLENLMIGKETQGGWLWMR